MIAALAVRALALAGAMALCACAADLRRVPKPEVRVTLKWRLGPVGVDSGTPAHTLPPSDACVQFGFGCP